MRASPPIVDGLRSVVGRRRVLWSSRATRRYRRGYRGEPGPAIAVVLPGSLIEFWRVLKVLIEHDVAILIQAANTGLTGGSTPDDRMDRPVVIVNVMRLDGVHLIAGATQVVCLPGATLHKLERIVRGAGRDPHSVIGSSCFGASVIGGVCNNSGGALVRRGPAYTELALFAQIAEDGRLLLVNNLEIDLGDDPETMLDRLERGAFTAAASAKAASDPDYATHVRQVDDSTPARFNADPRRLNGASGCAGHLAVFAVRLDTFAADPPAATFYVGSNDRAALSELRRGLLTAPVLPISAEYMHRNAFDVADIYGRDTFIAIRLLGTIRLPVLFAWKAKFDSLGRSLGIRDLSERLLQRVARWLPDHLPLRVRAWRSRYAHHLILSVTGDALASTGGLLAEFSSAESGWFECTADEAARASLHRFVTAGAATRYRIVHHQTTGGLVAIDAALPRNSVDWFDRSAELDTDIHAAYQYGHFLCHVFHRDYVIAKGVDPAVVKTRLTAALEKHGARYPAEHNFGRHYNAPAALSAFYRTLDPTNRFNPGVGIQSVRDRWG